ncbi:MAG: DNA primase DnaG [Candidatus Parvarchaeota archaeon]|nr:DNA primase DnaG [Candidatus Jingweiarchaeum tengchongense]MCW1298410.1 DNA primase DnaG [Candidatus Jingweiarchaeum tengchongense]MCW1300288.1 DNA primase DnaG [Candidatus Jingweiarchaeum tengchongense]MCW1310820.1 DNA primase DnaG [Candidatus Jingweiarchaeum tengchongense]
MGKIAPISAKYIIHAFLQADGVVEKPDVIGAIFGQTEGLLGTDLELRELQKSGRIGRIEVELDVKTGKTTGTIMIPSTLDKAETAIVAAALETIQRIGPCNARITISNIEDVRISKRSYVADRAKELLKTMIEKTMPDSSELTEEVKRSVRALEIIEYGTDRLPAGPGINESDEIIIVEGRADVINLLKNGIKNVIGLNGTSIPKTIVDLCQTKTTTVFCDGDRGGDLIIKQLLDIAEIDYVARAPPGKEVEELTKKEIHKALRARVPVEQIKAEFKEEAREERVEHRPEIKLDPEKQKEFKRMLEELIGTKGAYILDKNMNILGKVPLKELRTTIRNLDNVDVIIMDGQIIPDFLRQCEEIGVSYIVAMRSNLFSKKLTIITARDLGLI